MKTIPVQANGGILRLPEGITITPTEQLAVLVYELPSDATILREMAEQGGAFEFLKDEPDIYSDADILPNRKNPKFQTHG